MLNMLKLLTAAALLTVGANAQAEDWPTKPITIISTYAAGGPSDIGVRVFADVLSKIVKQPVLIDNKPGGGGVVGMSALHRSKPDGYTWAQVSGAFTVNPTIQKSLPYDTIKDFQGLTIFYSTPHAIVAYPGFAPSTPEELFAESKKRTLKFASAGVGSSSHMTGELIQSVAGVRWQHIPYNGDAEALADILSGRVDFTVSSWTNVEPQVKAGKLKLIAFSNPTRLPDYPDVPTLWEVLPAMKALPVGSWSGLVAPAGVPPDVLAKVADAIKTASLSDEYKEKAAAIGKMARYMTPDETSAYLKTEVETWARIVKEQNIVIGQ
ncbi:MAG: tripartite tricarboxylate transporter substrate binding protein [Bauldia sp.]